MNVSRARLTFIIPVFFLISTAELPTVNGVAGKWRIWHWHTMRIHGVENAGSENYGPDFRRGQCRTWTEDVQTSMATKCVGRRGGCTQCGRKSLRSWLSICQSVCLSVCLLQFACSCTKVRRRRTERSRRPTIPAFTRGIPSVTICSRVARTSAFTSGSPSSTSKASYLKGRW